jgi:hypothetical protein
MGDLECAPKGPLAIMPNGEVKAVNAIQVVATMKKSTDLTPRFFEE